MIHAIFNLNHAATVIDGVGHAVKRCTCTLHCNLSTKRYAWRCSTGVLAWVKFVTECVKKTALHSVIRRIIGGKECLNRICSSTRRFRAGILGERIAGRNVVQRIDGRAVLVHTEMQVTACRAASCTDGGNLLPGGDFRTLLDIECRGMPVEAHQTAAVVDADIVAVPAVPTGFRDRTGTKCKDWYTACRSEVNAVVELLAVERAGAVTVAARNARVGRTRPNIFTHATPP